MKAIRNRVFFTLEKETEDEYRLSTGDTIYIETRFDPARHARQYGRVVAVSPNIERYKDFKDGIELLEGDKIWVHHFAIEQSNKFEIDGRLIYSLPYDMLFAIERGEYFVPLGEFVFVRPKVVDTDFGSIINPLKGNLSNRFAEVVYINRFAKRELGIEEGDTVMLSGTGNYDMKIKGEVLYRMRMRQLILVNN